MTQTNPTLQQTLGGRFRLDRLLGTGGMGSVYVATDLSIGRQVALKLLRPELVEDRESLERMREEAISLAALRHPNVVHLYDFHAGTPETTFLLMEFVDGDTLAQRLRLGRIPVATAVDYTLQILSALAAAHARGIIHRDIKPSNVLVVSVPMQKELVKVLDFGIAKLTEETIRRRPTTAGMLLGTPSSMSPEQAGGRLVDLRTDIYAAGLLLYTLLAGSNPFRGESLGDVLVAVQSFMPAPLSEIRPDVPRALSDVISRSLAKDPSQRFSSAAEFGTAIERTMLQPNIVGPSQPGSIPNWAPNAIHASSSPPHRMSAAPPHEASWSGTSPTYPAAQHPPPSNERSGGGFSPGVVAVIAVLGTLLLVAIGALTVAFLGWPSTGGAPVAIAAADAGSVVTVPTTAPATSVTTAKATASVPANTSAPAPVAAAKGAQSANTAKPSASTLNPPVPADGKKRCQCFIARNKSFAMNHPSGLPLGQREVPLNCLCDARGTSLCRNEVRACAPAGESGKVTPAGCNEDGFTACDRVYTGKPDAPCTGWNTIAKPNSGKLDCQFPTEATFLSGSKDAPCTGLTVGLQRTEGTLFCQ